MKPSPDSTAVLPGRRIHLPAAAAPSTEVRRYGSRFTAAALANRDFFGRQLRLAVARITPASTASRSGNITAAVIVPPTSQNQPAIEEDLADFVQANLDLDDESLQWRCEQAIRNFDPCISCSTHFLQLTVDRG